MHRRTVIPFLSVCLFLTATAIPAAEEYMNLGTGTGGWHSMLAEAVRAFDAAGLILLMLFLALLGMAIDLLIHLRIGHLVPESLLVEVQEEMTNGEYEKALTLCEKSDSLIGQVFSAALAKTDYSFERMEEALRSETEIQALVWRNWVRQFKIMTLLGPVIGLVFALLHVMRLVSGLAGRSNFGLTLASSQEMRNILLSACASFIIGLLMSLLSLVIYVYASSKLEKILVESRRLGEELLDPFRPLPQHPEE